MFKKQVMPDVQSIFKKGGAGRQFSKMAGEAAGLAGVAGRELRRGANNPVLEQVGNMTVGADRTRQLRGAAVAHRQHADLEGYVAHAGLPAGSARWARPCRLCACRRPRLHPFDHVDRPEDPMPVH